MMNDLTRREFMGTGALLTAGAMSLAGNQRAFAEEAVTTTVSQYKTLKDRKIISELEMKHVPLIKTLEKVKKGEPFKLEVRVGRVLHPMQGPHHIEWIHLFKDGVPLATTTLTYEGLKPTVAVELVLEEPAEITAKIHCNLHGYWMETKKIEVS